jgi:hypothetical protein
VSTGVAAAAYRLSGDKRTAAAAFLAGTAIDADHFVDYAICRLTNSRDWVVLPLHGWEYLAGLVLAGVFRPPVLSVAAGYGIHLALDHVFNGLGPRFGYSLLWRLGKGLYAPRMNLAVEPHLWVQLPIRRWFY